MPQPALYLLETLRQRHPLPPDSCLLVAVSGGADSMALLHLYTRLRDEGRATIVAATFDHGLRGEAGAADAAFVAAACAAWGVPCEVGRATAPPPASGVEAWARRERYAFLARAARDFGTRYVVTAHHADDQAETILANIIRGTSGRGLAGMRPSAVLPGAPDLTLVRPLLDVPRGVLVAYCETDDIEWREDATNEDMRFRRNWIRHRVLPLLREANPDVTGALSRLARTMAEQDDFIALATKDWMDVNLQKTPHRVWFQREALVAAHPAVRSRLLVNVLQFIVEAAEPEFDRIQAALDLALDVGSGAADLGFGAVMTIDATWISIAPAGAPWMPPYDGYWLDETGRAMWTSDRDGRKIGGISVRIPPDTPVVVRARRDGDRVYPLSLGGRSQKLKDWFINHKISRQLRDHLPLLDAGGQIVALWDGGTWQVFSPQFPQGTIEIGLISILQNL